MQRFKTSKKIQPNYRIRTPTNSRSPISSRSPIFLSSKRDITPVNLTCYSRLQKSPLAKSSKISTFPNPIPKSTLLESLRKRKTSENSSTPSAALAQSVLKLYFLPFFQEQHKIDTDKLRYFSYGSQKRPLKQSYEPLSEILKKTLNSALNELAELRTKHESVANTTENLENELLFYKTRIFYMKTNKSVFGLNNTKMVLYRSPSSIQVQKLDFFRVFTENLILHKTYSTERENNECLKSVATQASFYHDQHYMINQISGEALRGAYYCMTFLKAPGETEGKIFRISSELNAKFTEKLEKNDKSFQFFSIIFNDLDHLISGSSKILKTRKALFKDIKSVKTAVVSYIDNLTSIMKVNLSQIDRQTEELEIREKEFEKFIDDYRSTQATLTEFQRSNRTKYLEYICKHCNKEFFEEDNFNWSCCIHLSEYSGEMYWCCGAKSKQSLGCQKRKHEAKNEEETEILKSDNETIKIWFCSCCRKSGHAAESCPYDPNRLVKNSDRKPQKVKRKISVLNKSLSTKQLWLHDLKEKSFEDIESFKEIVSRSVTPESSLMSKTSSFSLLSPARTVTSTQLSQRY